MPDSEKAGLVPYIVENGVPKFLVMVSSDPKYGGPRPMVSKGCVEEGESFIECAIREAEEELGLKRENICSEVVQIYDEIVRTKRDTYRLVMFVCEVTDKKNFNKPHYETKFAPWMTEESFNVKGRADHRQIVEMAATVAKNKIYYGE